MNTLYLTCLSEPEVPGKSPYILSPCKWLRPREERGLADHWDGLGYVVFSHIQSSISFRFRDMGFHHKTLEFQLPFRFSLKATWWCLLGSAVGAKPSAVMCLQLSVRGRSIAQPVTTQQR